VAGVVNTGKDAIRVPRKSARLVLMDIRLKGDMDGVQAAERSASSSRSPSST